MPLPSEETTPPVTKMKRVRGRDSGMQVSLKLASEDRAVRGYGQAFTPLAAAPSRGGGRRRPLVGARASAPARRPRRRGRSSVTVVRAVCARGVLDDREVAVGQRGDLRQVRDADDLAALGERAQLLAHRARGLAADAGVDLVEHERARRRPRRRRPSAPASRARARRPTRSPAAAPAGTPGFGAIRNSTSSAPVGPGDSRAARARPRTPRPPSPAPPSRSRTAVGQPRRRPSRAPRAARAAAVVELRAARASSSRPAVLDRLLGARQLVAPRAARVGVREHRRDRPAVLALEPVEQREPLLHLVQPARAPRRRPRRSGAARAARSSASTASARMGGGGGGGGGDGDAGERDHASRRPARASTRG